MGCAWSMRWTAGKKESPSFADIGGGGGGGGGGVTKRTAMLYDSTELRVLPPKTGASKVQDRSSILGRAGIVGLEKAVDVLDTLGSSMSNLNPNSGFTFGLASRGNKISILAFEVANTIAKGASMMRSLSEENVQYIKEDILQSEGVQRLVSMDTKELLRIAAADKREEFDVFSGEVVRFGNLCKDPEWHNLARYFQKLDTDPTSQKPIREEAEITMQQLMNMAQHTSELYQELNILDRFEQEYQRKVQEERTLPAGRRGEGLMILHSDLKQQRKLVKSLKKRALWSRNLEEVMEKLVDIVTFLHQGIMEAFGDSGNNGVGRQKVHNSQRLGLAGLALHYANIITQIDSIVSRPIGLPSSTRDTLYHGLPKGVKAGLRSRLQSFDAKEEFTVPHIKAEMQKILRWLVPIAENTLRAHQGFGWVGEWANMGTELNKKPDIQYNVIRIQTLHHADKEKTEEYILQLAIWLHHLVSQVRNRGYGYKSLNQILYPSRNDTIRPVGTKQGQSQACNGRNDTVLQLSQEDREMLEGVCSKKPVYGRSKSLELAYKKEKKGKKRYRLSRSNGSSPAKEFRASSLDLQLDRANVLDVIDGLDTLWPVPAASPYSHSCSP